MAGLEQAFDRFLYTTGKLMAARVEMDEATRLRRAALPRCGNCQHWMKTRDCAAEGRGEKPSMDRYPCGKYQESTSALGSPKGLRDKADEHEARAHAHLNAAKEPPDAP